MPKFDDLSKKVAEIHRSEEEELVRVLSKKYGHQYVNLLGIVIDTEALKLIDEEDARRAETVTFKKVGNKLSVAIRNPNKAEAVQALETLRERGYHLIIFMASTASLEHAWERYADIRKGTASKKGMLDIASEEIEKLSQSIMNTRDASNLIQEATSIGGKQNISRIVEIMLGGAIALRASDVHIEPEAGGTRVRYRLDGVLWDVADIPQETYGLLRSRLKLLSGIKLNVTDRAQDGRFTIDIGSKEFEIRSSVIPGAYGESFVMRILDPSSIDITIGELGINKFLMKVIEEEVRRPNGMIITTGPTGSGKTTTLYTFLQMVHKPEIKIITIEDPIEYHLKGIVQTQVTSDYSFVDGLRAILRQDPDIIMVGEIRDGDVAQTGIDAALTGHLVFSTLHTNSAVGSFPRLIDLGIDRRLIGSAVNLAMAQRLVRTLCKECKKERAITKEEQKRMKNILDGYPESISFTGKIFDDVGCNSCGESGFKGRVGVYEGIRVDSAIEKVLAEDPRESEILEAAKLQGIPTIQQDGIVKVLGGMTSLGELERVVDLYGRSSVEQNSAQKQAEAGT